MRKRWWSWVLSTVLVSGAGWPVATATAAELAQPAAVSLRDLPPEGREVWRLVHRGGPFRYEKDGSVFGNRERLLPVRRRGHYREYTVPTPGLRHRGARRIVCGGLPPTNPEVCYYTTDHYASFQRIVQ